MHRARHKSPPATEANTALVYYSLIDGPFGCFSSSSCSCRGQRQAQGRPPPKRMGEVRVEAQFGVNLPRWFRFCLFCTLRQLQCPFLPLFLLFLSALCAKLCFYHIRFCRNLSNFLCFSLSLCVRVFFFFVTLNPTSLSLSCLALLFLHLSIGALTCGFFSPSLQTDSTFTVVLHLSPRLSPFVLLCSHRHTLARTHTPLSPPRRLHLCARLWPAHGSGCRCGILEMLELSDTQVQWRTT